MKPPAKPPSSAQDAADGAAPDTRQQPAVHHLYDHHDPIPVPEAHESNTESVWALFEQGDSARPRRPQPEADDGFGATVPAPLEGLERRQGDFDAPTEYSPLLSDFDIPTRHTPLPGGSGFDDTTRAADLHTDFDAPTQAAPLGRRPPKR